MPRTLEAFALAAAVGLTLSGTAAAQARSPNGMAPTSVDGTVVGPDLFQQIFGSQPCGFPVTLTLSGLQKNVFTPANPAHPTGRTFVVSPAQQVTVTNDTNPTRQVTLNITGTVRTDSGAATSTSTGRVLVLDPAFLTLAVGTFTFPSTPVQAPGTAGAPKGKGQLIDVCALVQ